MKSNKGKKMKKQILLSLAVSALLFADATKTDSKVEADLKGVKGESEKAFGKTEIKGQIRGIYQSNSKLNGESTSDFLIGGKLGIETYVAENFSAGATFYTSQPVSNKKDFKDGDYYTRDNKGYSILGEAYAKYANEDTEIKLGRMELDLPFANADDIRMVPNLYTAAIASYKPIKGLNLTVGAVTQMAGWENGVDHTRFVKMGEVIESAVADEPVWGAFFANNSGARESKLYLAGAVFERDMFGAQAWYARQSEIMDSYYLEANVKPFESEALSVNVVGQYMKEKTAGKLKSYSDIAGNEVAKIDSNIYGFAIELESAATGLTAALAYNKSGKKDGYRSNGGTASFFGGGKDPLLTSMDVETANGEGDIKAYKGELGFNFEKAGVSGLNASLAHAYFDKKAGSSYSKETDLVLSYALDKASVELTLSNIKSKDAEDNNRLRIYVKYDF